MGSWFSTGIYVVTGVVAFIVSVAVFAVLRARHPKERDERFLWSEAQRIAGVGLAVVLLGGVVFITLRYS